MRSKRGLKHAAVSCATRIQGVASRLSILFCVICMQSVPTTNTRWDLVPPRIEFFLYQLLTMLKLNCPLVLCRSHVFSSGQSSSHRLGSYLSYRQLLG
jgi:hypothetical protein